MTPRFDPASGFPPDRRIFVMPDPWTPLTAAPTPRQQTHARVTAYARRTGRADAIDERVFALLRQHPQWLRFGDIRVAFPELSADRTLQALIAGCRSGLVERGPRTPFGARDVREYRWRRAEIANA